MDGGDTGRSGDDSGYGVVTEVEDWRRKESSCDVLIVIVMRSGELAGISRSDIASFPPSSPPIHTPHHSGIHTLNLHHHPPSSLSFPTTPHSPPHHTSHYPHHSIRLLFFYSLHPHHSILPKITRHQFPVNSCDSFPSCREQIRNSIMK